MNSFEILNIMKPALRPLPKESGGSHSKIFFIDADHLGEILAGQAGPKNADKARELGRQIGERFLLKIGNIHDYVIKLKNGNESVIRRALPSEAFGPGGYNIAPTLEKVHTDVREAVRQIPFIGYGDRRGQLAPDILGDIARCLVGEKPGNSADGTFLVEDTLDGIKRISIREILKSDPFFKATVNSIIEMQRFQEYLRFSPIDASTEQRLSDFFNAPITVGIRDIIRYLEGSRHPSLGWESARKVIDKSFTDYGHESFICPEFNYYTDSLEYSPEHLDELKAGNITASKHFARILAERVFVELRHGGPSDDMSDSQVEALADAILCIHYDYPVFEIDPQTAVISTATARLIFRSSVCTAAHLLDIKTPDRRNPLSESSAKRASVVSEFVKNLPRDEHELFFFKVNSLLWEFAARGGVPDENLTPHPYRRINKTFYCFQELAPYPLKMRGTLEKTVTLEDIYGPEGKSILAAHPELAPKLLVFFIMTYRYYTETGHIPDLRPDDAGIDLFIKGIYGYSTRNVLVALGRDSNGNPDSDVRFVDSRDQFKQYRRWEDRDKPLGIVKYGMRLLSPLARPGLERAIGIYTSEAAGKTNKPVPRMAEDISIKLREVLRRSVDAATNGSRVFLEDALDDTSKEVEKVIKRMSRDDQS